MIEIYLFLFFSTIIPTSCPCSLLILSTLRVCDQHIHTHTHTHTVAAMENEWASVRWMKRLYSSANQHCPLSSLVCIILCLVRDTSSVPIQILRSHFSISLRCRRLSVPERLHSTHMSEIGDASSMSIDGVQTAGTESNEQWDSSWTPAAVSRTHTTPDGVSCLIADTTWFI